MDQYITFGTPGGDGDNAEALKLVDDITKQLDQLRRLLQA